VVSSRDSLLILSLLAILVSGCRETEPGKPKRTAESRAPATTPVSAAAKSDETAVDVEIRSWAETQKLIAAASGKVVVIDVWSLHCQPCVREFQGLVKLAENHPSDVACISFDIDYDGSKDNPPESYRADVLKFLKEKHAHLRNIISNEPNEDFLNLIKLGGPPAVFVYDQKGKLIRRFDNSTPKQPEFTYEKDVIPLVEQLLAGS
jgi:thiol-disulfide isomerase/thioredoxin